jgi:S-DNA-T family DNA segregation ATPase FtsK/SpoIIIE
MAENTYKSPTKKTSDKKDKSNSKPIQAKLSFNFLKDKRFQLASGLFLTLCSVAMFIAFTSYLFTGVNDQSLVESLGEASIAESGKEVQNWLGVTGAYISYHFIFKWFGIASFLFVPLVFLLGARVLLKRHLLPFGNIAALSIFLIFWIGLCLGYVVFQMDSESYLVFLCGGFGYELAVFSNSLLGWGTALFIIFSLLVFAIFFFNITSFTSVRAPILSADNAEDVEQDVDVKVSALQNAKFLSDSKNSEDDLMPEEDLDSNPTNEDESELEQWVVSKKDEEHKQESRPSALTLQIDHEEEVPQNGIVEDEEEDLDLLVDEGGEEVRIEDKNFNFDPTLDLSSYQYPSVDLLAEYEPSKVQVSKDELEANKDKIVETLSHYSIGIASIKATIGPTVTLYEIVPEAGVRISKIKNLEDDIALSLAALGIRIIAPMPGKGTIGIEVPNKNKEMVSIRSVLATDKFMKSTMDLPIVFGKTISNELFVIDLAKMPHLLIAGATGQGKSVGLNVLLTSLIYKKHPSQLKLVLVDPKKVELSLFNKIERHFLAKLPDTDEAIITDTKKVIHTLNSLCMEMDQRYDLLKEANCRNLKEYNKKFVERRLNPEKGHRFMPYIVLVIDELADLMMTAGKEVETPIARLAQLARAIGIHLVVATQRPSVNVITGIIKANFPARISFKVTSKIDSRTILDTGGADQLIGQGDMLFTHGSELIRLQCAFVDTPEVESVCEFIGSQRGYPSAYHLPEYQDEESGGESGNFDFNSRDDMFEEAARLIVAHQQGSTSLIQRKLKLGYNRAGRIIDQLESVGVVGQFEGSKAREVLIRDEYSLEQLLNELNNKKSS